MGACRKFNGEKSRVQKKPSFLKKLNPAGFIGFVVFHLNEHC